MTPEIEQQYFSEPLPYVKRIIAEVKREEEKTRKAELDELTTARNFVYGGEWDKVRTRPIGGDRLNLGIPRSLIDLAVNRTFDREFYVAVRATDLPQLDPMQAEFLQSFSQPLAIDPMESQWALETVGALKTHELDTYRRELKIHAKAREAFRRSLTDKVGVLVDGVTPEGNRVLSVDVAIYGDEYFAQRQRDYERVNWHVYEQYLDKAQFEEAFPWVIEKYLQEGKVESPRGFFQRFLTRHEDTQTGRKRQQALKQDRIKIRTIWYRKTTEGVSPETGQGGAPFGTWLKVTEFEGEPLACEPNPFLDGKHPFHVVVPHPTEDSWAGQSWILQHHDAIVSLNKGASIALLNVIEACNNVRVWNPAALQNPEELRRVDAGLRELVLKHGFSWDQAVHDLPANEVSQSVFAVFNLLKSILGETSGLGAMTLNIKDGNVTAEHNANADKPTSAFFLDVVKEQLESLFYNLACRSTQFADQPRSFSLLGEETVAIRFNPQLFAVLFNGRFWEHFDIVVDEMEPLPEDPEKRDAIKEKRLALAANMAATLGLPMSATVAMTKPPDWMRLQRLLKRQELEAAQQGDTLTAAEKEKQAIQENEKVKTIAQIFQKWLQEQATDVQTRPEVTRWFMTGQVRPMLEAAITGQPMPDAQPQQTLQMSVPDINAPQGIEQPGQLPPPPMLQ